MNLYLLRHGQAVEPGSTGSDAARGLTAEGEHKLKQIAGAMKALELSFDAIFSSPYLRARQTAEIVARQLGYREPLVITEALVPDGSAKKLVEELRRLGHKQENILLVGHEPHLSGLISLLVGGEMGFAVVMKKGGLCKLSTESLRPGGCASLEWLLTPKIMALMDGHSRSPGRGCVL